MTRYLAIAILLAATGAARAADTPPAKPAAAAPKAAAAAPAKPAAPAAKPAAAAAAPKPAKINPVEAFHLKPGAMGKNCVNCHATFQDTLKQPFVHTPVKSGECAECHSPHASDHGKLLAADKSQICTTCHTDIALENAQSIHPDVAAGNCVKCHDPHASKNKANLLKSGNEVCFTCHAELGKAIAAAKFKHSPVTKSCLGCHDPHATGKTSHLLAKDVPALCLGCHKADAPAFQKAHLNYPVAKGDCTSCHDPHGSDQGSILWATVHQPVKNKMCAQCHNDASSPDALKTKRTGLDVCRSCHSQDVNTALADARVHWPVVDKTACLNCHRPHASRTGKLLQANEKQLCGRCHADAVARQTRSLTKHQPIDDGMCTACHRPHSSNTVFLLDGANVPEVCGKCHDWGKHSSHPIGPKVIDPRNKNLTLDCLACHRTHGTENKHLTHFDTKKDLCVQCHTSMGG